jgi:hypothetical protein
LKDEPASGLDFREIFKAAPDIRINGPAAGGGYVLRTASKVKVAGNRRAPGDSRPVSNHEAVSRRTPPIGCPSSCDRQSANVKIGHNA